MPLLAPLLMHAAAVGFMSGLHSAHRVMHHPGVCALLLAIPCCGVRGPAALALPCRCRPPPQGYNASIVAYGQTGTGKTYTMEGERTGAGRGIIPRAIEDVFGYIQRDTGERCKFLVRASYLQIYNEVRGGRGAARGWHASRCGW